MKHTILFLFTLLFSIQAYASIGQITAVSGTASIERNQTQIMAKAGLKIEEKDVIQTGDKTQVQIVFNDKTTVTLGSNTNFIVNKYEFGSLTNSQAEFGLTKGFLKSVSGKIGKLAPARFKIKTKTATIGIRGTTFTVVTNDKFTRLATFKGATYLTDNATGTTYDVPKDKQLSFNHSSGKATIATLAIADNTESKTSSSQTSSDASTETPTENDTENTTGDTTDVTADIVDETTTETPVENAKIVEGSATYTSYGYWLNEETAEVTSVWIEAAPQTDPSVLDGYIGTNTRAEYNGGVLALDSNNNLATGDIKIKVDFDGGSTAIDGDIDYTFNAGTAEEIRWDTKFEGAVTNDGFTLTDFTVKGGSDIDGINGTIDGKFYGPNGQEVSGNFDLQGQHEITGEAQSSTGVFNAISTEAEGIKP
ncbi:FecR domain-containing protein [Thiomicrorhabdus lithotrophica]|uniref:FecR domain-containing protein n=1 Tax=Thiomicrorhabdus lithotrophica TaxID=2949997 RepID=A0ABY8CF74_9GAMM|nr:FecR domain-containing protein [Thiomicrorhabdus lithotrophica]WEJ62763.1 FecR domain-containing protein [Thiomicrorhabdus lithotrophica]